MGWFTLFNHIETAIIAAFMGILSRVSQQQLASSSRGAKINGRCAKFGNSSKGGGFQSNDRTVVVGSGKIDSSFHCGHRANQGHLI